MAYGLVGLLFGDGLEAKLILNVENICRNI